MGQDNVPSEVTMIGTAAKIRRHLTPAGGMRAALRASSGTTYELRREMRRDVSERVTLVSSASAASASSFDGWTLNVSRGGVRMIIERPVELGEVFDVTIGLADAYPMTRQGQVVWFQEEADGYIVGMKFNHA